MLLYREGMESYCEISTFYRITQCDIEDISIPGMTHWIIIIDEDMEREIWSIFGQVFLCLFELIRSDQGYPTCSDTEFFHDEYIDM